VNPQTFRPTVFLIDDDPAIRAAFSRTLATEGFETRLWDTADAFLAEHDVEMPGCVVTDVAMPGMNGLDLQRALLSRGYARPIVFVTGQGNIRMSVQAMRAGAVTFLPKPVRAADLAEAVREAIEEDRRLREARARRATVESRLGALTLRERQVLRLVIAGRMNKQIAAELGAAEKTIKVHRGRVMSKMHVRSVAELVTLTAQVGEFGAAPIPP
jgi:FixJ family two-component response regulator